MFGTKNKRILGYGLQRPPKSMLRELRWRVCTSTYIHALVTQKLGLSTSCWLFLLGLNNSGTTLLSRMIGAHPDVSWMNGEGQWMTKAFLLPHHVAAVSPMRSQGIGRLFAEREDLFRWTEDHDALPALRAMYDWSYYLTARRYLFEGGSPTHTLRGRWLQKHFVPSRFIALVRSPYAVCEGIHRRDGFSIERAARHWTRGNEILMADIPYLSRCLLLRYEELCDCTHETLARIEDFLQLSSPFDRSILQQEFKVHSITNGPARIANMNQKSVERLSATDIVYVNGIAGSMMAALGYEMISPGRDEGTGSANAVSAV